METIQQRSLRDLMQGFDTAMLVTLEAGGRLRSRPMANVEVEDDGTVWFLSEKRSGKIQEIAHHDQVNIVMQSKLQFVSLSGRATEVDDRRKIGEVWKETWKVWFPKGQNDPNLTLLKITPEAGEYWDNSGTSGIKYLIEAGKAYLTGTKPDVAGDPKIHGKVDL